MRAKSSRSAGWGVRWSAGRASKRMNSAQSSSRPEGRNLVRSAASSMIGFKNRPRAFIPVASRGALCKNASQWRLGSSNTNLARGYTMIRITLLTSAALALVATGAYAGPQVTLSKDNRTVSVAVGKPGTAGSPVQFAGTYSVNTFAKKYPNGLYFCCYGDTLSGPSSFFGAAYATATQWTQAAN